MGDMTNNYSLDCTPSLSCITMILRLIAPKKANIVILLTNQRSGLTNILTHLAKGHTVKYLIVHVMLRMPF